MVFSTVGSNKTILNIDAVDGVLDALGTYRVLFREEPRYIRTFDVKDIDTDNIQVLKGEITKISNHLKNAGMTEGEDFFIKESYSGKSEIMCVFYGDHFAIELSRYEYQSTSVFTFSVALSYSQYENVIFTSLIKKYEKRLGKTLKDHSSKIYVINRKENGLSLVNFPIRKNAAKEKGIEFEELYNDDFFPKSERIIEFLKTPAEKRDSNGIVVLQGKYGTGKTNYLRHLIRKLNKKIIFLPPELSAELANPGFVTFLMDHSDSVLIIEDAENVLKTREAGGNQAVANLLNMSDGILGDALSLQIICTLNADMDHIDKALLREGRLVEMYEFKELSEEKTTALFAKLYGEDAIPPKKEMTLSQIFKCEQFERGIIERPEKAKFGFV